MTQETEPGNTHARPDEARPEASVGLSVPDEMVGMSPGCRGQGVGKPGLGGWQLP